MIFTVVSLFHWWREAIFDSKGGKNQRKDRDFAEVCFEMILLEWDKGY